MKKRNLLVVISVCLLTSFNIHAQKQFEIQLNASALKDAGLDDLKHNFLNQPSIKFRWNLSKLSIEFEGGILENKADNLLDLYPNMTLIADLESVSDVWKSQYYLAGPAYTLFDKKGLRLRGGVMGGVSQLVSTPRFRVSDRNIDRLHYQVFNAQDTTYSSFLIKPSFEFSYFPGGGSIGLSFGISYLNQKAPPSASGFTLDFTNQAFPSDIQDPERLFERLQQWPIIDQNTDGINSGISFNAGVSLAFGGKKTKKSKPKLPEDKPEKPKKDKDIIARKEKKRKKQEKEIAKLDRKKKKNSPEDPPMITKSGGPAEEETEIDPCACIIAAQGMLGPVEVERLFPADPYNLTLVDPSVIVGAYSVCSPSMMTTAPPTANDHLMTLLPGDVEQYKILFDEDPTEVSVQTNISGWDCDSLVTDKFDIPEIVECGAIVGGVTEPILDLIPADTTGSNERILINSKAKGDWILANNGWSSPTQTYELFTRWTPLVGIASNHQPTPTDSIHHTFYAGELTTFGHMKAEYWVWEAGAPVCRQIFDVYYSNDTTNTPIYAGESGEFEITQAGGGGYDIVPGVPFSGTGEVYVPWMAQTVSLEFQDIECDATGRLLNGEIIAEVDPSAPSTPRQWLLGAIASNVDYDHSQVQAAMEWADSNLVDIEYLGTGGPLAPLGDPAINMPMVLNLDPGVNDSRFAITEMVFEPNKSKFNAVVALDAPAEWNVTETIGFAAKGVPFHPTDVVSPPERITLVDDILLNNVNSDIHFRFKAPAEPFDPYHQGCYIEWDETGFEEFGLEIAAEFTREWFTPIPDDSLGVEKSTATLVGTGTAWNDLIISGDWPKSRIENAHGMTIEVDHLNLDLSDSMNPIDMDFPTAYGLTGVDTTSLWRGFFAENVELGLPESWDTFDTLSTGQPKIGVHDLFIDDQGLTMLAYAHDVVQWPRANIADLNASVDTIHIEWLFSSLTEAHIKGTIGLPASHPDSIMNPLKYDGFFLDSMAIALDTTFNLPGSFSDTVGVLGLVIEPAGPIYANMLRGMLELEPTSQIVAYKQDTVKNFSMLLDGDIIYDDVPLGNYLKLDMEVGFNGLGMIYNSVNSLEFELGTWSLASPQKSANGFPFSIENIELNPLPKTAGQRYHGSLDFDVLFALGDTTSSISAGSSLGIEFEVVDSPADSTKFKPKYLGADLDSLGIDAHLAAVDIEGYLSIGTDSIYGKRFTGGLDAYFKGPGFGIDVDGEFGNTNYMHTSKYRYWKVDAGTTFGSPVPFLAGLGFYGFSGGAYGNMELDIVETAPDTYTKTYTPSHGAWGFKAGATIGTVPLQDAFNADISLEAAFSGGGISYITFEGLFGTNAKIADRRNGEGFINGSLLTFYDFPAKHFFLGADATINSPPITTPSPISLALDIDGLASEWYFICGKPDYNSAAPELMNEVNIDLSGSGGGITLYEYFMFGNNIPYPNGFTYKFREAYKDKLDVYPGFDGNVGSGGADSNSELGKGMALGIGFQFEQEGEQHISGNYHLGYDMSAGAEVNLSYMRYAGSCAGHNPIGTNGWRAKGNLGLYATAAARVDKKNGSGTVTKTWTIADLRAGAWVTGEFPNPHYAAGAIDGQAKIGHWVGKAHPLGHWKPNFPWTYEGPCHHHVDKYLLNVNVHKAFEIGHQCNNVADNTTPTFTQENITDDFDDILIEHVSPLQNFNYPETAPIAVKFAFDPGEVFHVSEQQGSGAIINRTFRLDYTRSLKRKNSGGSWIGEYVKHEVNDIGEYQFIRSTLSAVSGALAAAPALPSGPGPVPATAAASPAALASLSGGPTILPAISALPAALASLSGGISSPPPAPPPLVNTLSDNTYYRFTVSATLMEYNYDTETWAPALKSDGTPMTDEVIKTFRTGPMEPWVGVSGSLSTY